MSLVLAVAVVVASTAVAIAAMLLVRRKAPDGGYFNDGDRAAGVFGVLATGFSVLLGFVVFLAFSSYDVARAGAEAEALTVAQQIESALLLPEADSDELVAELLCYARSVAGVQWDRMQDGSLGEDLNPWAVELFRTIETVDPQSVTEQAAYSQWLDQTADREAARQDRVHGAVGVMPTPLWIVLFFITAVIFVFMLFFADSGERALVQGVLMGSVVAVISATMLLLFVLDHPFRAGIGGLEPVAMERTLQIIEEELAAADLTVTIPCDEAGLPVG
jgi:Protein of unknown function (DUF4239)